MAHLHGELETASAQPQSQIFKPLNRHGRNCLSAASGRHRTGSSPCQEKREVRKWMSPLCRAQRTKFEKAERGRAAQTRVSPTPGDAAHHARERVGRETAAPQCCVAVIRKHFCTGTWLAASKRLDQSSRSTIPTGKPRKTARVNRLSCFSTKGRGKLRFLAS